MTPELEHRYSEPHRRYHTIEHVHACLAELACVEDLSEDQRRVLEFAIWWHDAIYDPASSDNEDLSALLAEQDLADLGEPVAVRAEVARLIRLTKSHLVEPQDRLGAVLVSIDLCILGAPPADYDRYAAAIREEYAHVPEPLFRAARAAVLRRFLSGPIYPDPAIAARLEARAHANLARELETLAG